MLKLLKKYTYQFLGAAIFIYISLFSWLSLKKYYNFNYNIFDLAIFNQVFYNTVNGRWFAMTFNLNNYLADHFTPIIILLLPFYYFWQNPQILLIMQSIILALCVWPIYLISQKVIGNKLISLGISLLWLVNPLLHNGNMYEFHLLPLAVFFILWSFYFYNNNNFKLWLLFYILTLLVREDMGLVLLGFSILAILDKRDKKWIFTPGLGILYFLSALKLVSFINLGDNNKFFLYYAWLGGDSLGTILLAWFSHPWQFLRHLLHFNNITSIFVIFISLGFLPLLAPRYLWLLFFPLVQFALTAQGINSAVYNMHYALIFLPGLFIATIFAINKLKEKKIFIFSAVIINNKNFFIVLFVFTVCYFSIFLSPVKNILFNSYSTDFRNNRQDFINQIPPEASLVVSAGLAPALSSRTDIYPLQYSYLGRTQFYLTDFEFPTVDYILIDMKDMFDILSYAKDKEDFYNKEFKHIQIPGDFRKRLNDYVLIKVANNLLLWQNKSLSASKKSLSLYKFEDKPLNFNNSNFIISSDYLEQVDYNVLSITYQKIHQVDKNYLVRFYKDDYYFDLPLDYGLWPVKDWPSDNLVSFYYYLNQDVKAYQIFSWQGDVKLGAIRDAQVEFDLKPVQERLYINPAFQ